MRKKDSNSGIWAQVATADGLRLDGFLQSPVAAETELTDSDHVALLMHGAGANFYGASLVNRVGTHLLKDGWPVLRANNRGHDGWHVAFRGGKLVYLGSAFERLEESVLDIVAWLDWLQRSGYRRVTLLGHSLGAFKSLFTLSQLIESEVYADRLDLIQNVVAISPPALTQSGFSSSIRQQDYLQTIRQCETMLEQEQQSSTFWATYPFPMLLSPGCYLNKYVSGERFHFLSWLDSLQVPVYWNFGGQELEGHDVLSRSVEQLQQQLPSHHEFCITEGADHFFTGFTREVCRDVVRWLGERR